MRIFGPSPQIGGKPPPAQRPPGAAVTDQTERTQDLAGAAYSGDRQLLWNRTTHCDLAMLGMQNHVGEVMKI